MTFDRTPLPLPALLLATASLVLGCPASDPQGDETETGASAEFVLRTVSGGSFDAQGMSFVQCIGDPTSGYTRYWLHLDDAGSSMVESSHDDPDCSDAAVDAAQFDIEGGPAGDISIVGWEPGYQPAHIDVPVTATRIDAQLTGEDGQTLSQRTVLLVDDSVDPPRVYSGRDDGPVDGDGFPTTLWDDFLVDEDAPITGVWIATAAAEVARIDTGERWARCVEAETPGAFVYETWAFENDRLILRSHDNGADPGCAEGEAGAVDEQTWVVIVYRDIEERGFEGAPPDGIDATQTATHVRLWNVNGVGSRLLLLDEGASPPMLYVSGDGEGFTPEQLESTGLTRLDP